ncbi:mannitol dehydrogenase family protein [Phenylobacterium sp.]|uniref:mannitol dehydrogenase family protein n=1 Tax=Phenylobacterium sp. TaxID=1871053 RepID=UPI002F411381
MSARLSEATLAQAKAEVVRPAYDRAATRIGWLHFGPGAFHRAHQAFYADRMLAADPGLAISAVSLRSDDLRQALGPQDGLYSLLEREAEPRLRVIGSIQETATAPRDPAAVFARLTDPGLRVISATVTEKGYCLTVADDLDEAHPDVLHDLAGPPCPRTLTGWLVEGLRRRMAAGLPAPAVLSCDNLAGNGGKLRRAVRQFAEARGEADLARWIAGEVRFPDSMVDSITPATDEALRADVARRLGLSDAWPVQREGFTQWVVEDRLGAEAPAFAEAGVILTGDVAAFERAKLRLLNGAHSTLAYVGLRLGHATVAQAMADRKLAAFVEALMRADIAASLGPAAGLEVDGYIGDILARFRNPAIAHRLSQIAWDGSQKLPIRLLRTIGEARAAGRPVARLAVGVAAWMLFVRDQAMAGVPIVDPLAETLADLGRACDGDPTGDTRRFLALTSVFPRDLAGDGEFGAALARAYGRLSGGAPREALA